MTPTRAELVARASNAPIDSLQPLSGGSISDVCRVNFRDGGRRVAKFARPELLEEEAEGLEALRRTGTVRVPEVQTLIVDGECGMLLMEALPIGGEADWAAFGRTLAELHRAPVGDRYGFSRNNHLGTTPQINHWMEDWTRFNLEQRHGPLVEGLAGEGGLAGPDLEIVQRALVAFDVILPRRPVPSLLHGDLWSGNALSLVGGEVGVIDPAPSIGDALADIAMMQLFGGFPEACFTGYLERGGQAFEPLRLSVYRLYHLLNHQRIFGGGYRSGVLRECRLILEGVGQV